MTISTSSHDALREKAASVCETLDAEYGALVWRSHGEPMGALVMTILSQHTSDKNSERAYDNLRRTFPTWDAVRDAETGAIADAIRSGGLADSKAPRIKSVLQAIYEDRGTTNLDFLEDLSTEAARAYLLSLHGVGPKTMACVLMFSLGRPVLPVDTHVFRVSHRLGLIPQKIGEAKAHNALESLLEPERVYAFHVHMIRHGRRVCVAQRPRCSACVLQNQCEYFRSGAASAGSKVFDTRDNVVKTIHGMPTP
ncbi:MAG: endonuclease III [Armatimonadota bacterium]